MRVVCVCVCVCVCVWSVSMWCACGVCVCVCVCLCVECEHVVCVWCVCVCVCMCVWITVPALSSMGAVVLLWLPLCKTTSLKEAPHVPFHHPLTFAIRMSYFIDH